METSIYVICVIGLTVICLAQTIAICRIITQFKRGPVGPRGMPGPMGPIGRDGRDAVPENTDPTK